jgi:predicted DNA-binding transcriptional regulator AlpA
MDPVMNPTTQYLIDKYGLILNTDQVAEVLQMSRNQFLIQRHIGNQSIPKMKKQGRRLVTTAVEVARYIDSLAEES